ncbi:VVA0879 family protein [Vibrio navarrensis]|uniref:VVA0879 family protein n=1 Tax=Vibrio navarrensis TaxID=29495 RepID=UPI001558B131|nr:VVA0879 family protein [Vibrio navarrensis]
MPIVTLTIEEFQARIKAQGHKDAIDVTFQCPKCKTLQSLRQLMEATGLDRQEAGRYLGFSCIGRFNNKEIGCDWTLGGLFQIHELEVVDEEGKRHPHFMPMTPEQAEDESNHVNQTT